MSADDIDAERLAAIRERTDAVLADLRERMVADARDAYWRAVRGDSENGGAS